MNRKFESLANSVIAIFSFGCPEFGLRIFMYSSLSAPCRYNFAPSMQYLFFSSIVILLCDEGRHQPRFDYISLISGLVTPLIIENKLKE